MRYKIEIAALLIGFTGAVVTMGLATAWGAYPVEFTKYFKFGQIGFKALTGCFLIGLAGFVFMSANLITGLRKLWKLRLIGFICFLFFSASAFGLYG